VANLGKIYYILATPWAWNGDQMDHIHETVENLMHQREMPKDF